MMVVAKFRETGSGRLTSREGIKGGLFLGKLAPDGDNNRVGLWISGNG